MKSAGRILRRSREQKGYTLESIATRTKIPLNSLSLLEEDRFDDLPGDIFVRGFIKLYCQAIEMEESSVLEAYMDRVVLPSKARQSLMSSIHPVVLPGRVRGLSWILALALLVILGGVLLMIVFHQNGTENGANSHEEAAKDPQGKVETTL